MEMLIILVATLCISFLPMSKASAAPNIIFILADDLGWDDVGFHGSEIKTPNIDRLATEGVILNNYYVQPICTPTRGSILSGRYPIHTGLQHYVIVGSQPYGLPLNVTTLPQYLRGIGYKTHAVGKWHLGFCSDAYIPESRGFDSFLGYYTGHSDYFDHYTHDGTFMGYDLHFNESTLWNRTEVYSTELFTEQAQSIIQAHNKSSPLFLYLAHQAVHAGNFDVLQAPQKYIDRFGYITNIKRKYFAGMVSALDDSVGAVYQSLIDHGMENNTIIVFSTDNGGPTNGYDRNAACNWPLRGCKDTLWQGGVRGVGFLHSPLLKQKGYVNDNMMHVTDWLPTLISAATDGTSTTKNKDDTKKSVSHLDGFDQWDVISQNKSTQRKEVLLNIDPIEKREAIIIGDFKLLYGYMSGGKYDGWYPPPPHNASQVRASWSNKCQNSNCQERKEELSKTFDFKSKSPQDISDTGNVLKNDKHLDDIILFMNEEHKRISQKNYESGYKTGESSLVFLKNDAVDLSNEKGSNRQASDPVIIKCGPKPANASTNCNPEKKACLFNIKIDPCEYNNLADVLPSVVEILQARLQFYREGMVPPANKPIDPKGNPQLHGGVWKPWLK